MAYSLEVTPLPAGREHAMQPVYCLPQTLLEGLDEALLQLVKERHFLASAQQCDGSACSYAHAERDDEAAIVSHPSSAGSASAGRAMFTDSKHHPARDKAQSLKCAQVLWGCQMWARVL